VIGGILRMLIPDRAAAIAGAFVDSGALPVGAVVALALGAVLSFEGYRAES
jgi:hypothetical protein